MKNDRWPSSIRALKRRFPNRDLVQMRVTFADGGDVAFDGVIDATAKAALLKIIGEVLVRGETRTCAS
jgi:hypothetical protein